MAETRPPYPPEFQLEAVRMLRSGARSPNQLAAELGCSAQTLRNWLRQDEADRGERSDLLSSEFRALRRKQFEDHIAARVAVARNELRFLKAATR